MGLIFSTERGRTLKERPLFNDLAVEILKDRYLWKDREDKIIETPEVMLTRVAEHVASVEPDFLDRSYYASAFYNMMARLDFLPNSPTLMNAGRPAPHGQLAACFVVGVEDSMEGICAALRKQMLIHKTGGGTGFNFSNLRSKNSKVCSTNGRASGPVSFMRLFDLSTEVVQQGGMRRGANMAILNADHPDIEEFILCKDEEGKIANFNLSVGITNEFMQKALDTPYSREAEILDLIAVHAYMSGDPGVVFLDALNRDNPCPQLGTITATNPCGESPLLDNEACNLGSINLSNFYDAENDKIDYSRLMNVVWDAVRFLDNVIDAGQYPLPEIERAVKRTRKIGLGVMGFADLLYKMKIPYDSPAALRVAGGLMNFIHRSADVASKNYGAEKGIPFACERLGRRNATVTCIAPTGTLALLAGCSSGVEPVFSLYHSRTVSTVDGGKHEVDIFHPIYAELSKDMTINASQLSRICVTAYDIAPLDHVRMQAVFQKYTDLAVSKTVNLPNDATVDDVLNVYIEAWKLGCKGTTVYRDGSKGTQVLTVKPGSLPEPKCTTC